MVDVVGDRAVDARGPAAVEGDAVIELEETEAGGLGAEPSPFGDLFEKAKNPTGRSPFYDLESHFWARDQQRELMRIAAGWWAVAWFVSEYSEDAAIRLGNRARKFEARADRLSYSEWATGAAMSIVGVGLAAMAALFLFTKGPKS